MPTSIVLLYRWLEYMSFGPWLARCRSAQLTHLTSARRALLLGDGDGRFLARLLAANPTLTADVVDSSHAMLTLLDRRLRSPASISAFTCTTPMRRNGIPQDPAISTSSFSSLLPRLFFPSPAGTPVRRLLPHALPGARWVISEFAIPRNPVAAWLARGIIRGLYQAFGWITGLRVRALPDYAPSLRRRGLR